MIPEDVMQDLDVPTQDKTKTNTRDNRLNFPGHSVDVQALVTMMLLLLNRLEQGPLNI